MTEYITLLGAEQVQSAANTMGSAAREMKEAASSMDDALRQHRLFLDEWVQRFAQAVEPTSPTVKPADPMISLCDLLRKVDALKDAYPPPTERGVYAAQSSLFELYQTADTIYEAIRRGIVP